MTAPAANFITFPDRYHPRAAEVLPVRSFYTRSPILQDSSLDLFPKKLYNLYKLRQLFF